MSRSACFAALLAARHASGVVSSAHFQRIEEVWFGWCGCFMVGLRSVVGDNWL